VVCIHEIEVGLNVDAFTWLFNETRVVKRKQNRNDIFINISLFAVDVSDLPAGDQW
jgi:hypothetical protein